MNGEINDGSCVRGSSAPWIFVTTVAFVLTLLGLVMLFTASQSVPGGGYPKLAKQAVWTVVAVVGFLIACRLPLDFLRRHAWILYGATILGLILTLAPGIGIKVNGAQRWLSFGPARLQVSEFAKVGLVLAMAHYLALNQRETKTFRKGFIGKTEYSNKYNALERLS